MKPPSMPPGSRSNRFVFLDGVLSDEILCDHSTMLLLVSRSAEERVAGFIVELSQRLSARGYSDSDIGLWMTREEIGSYLGLKLETVSRLFSKFQRDGLLQVQGRTVKLLDRTSLRRLIENSD